jgi:hypothetical protein
LTASGATSYTWNLSTPSASNAGVSVAPLSTTVYSVGGTDANGCVNSQTATVIVNACAGLAEELVQPLLQVYPNPSQGFVHAVLREAAQIQVFDALGREIIKGNFAAGDQLLNLTEQPAGQYLIKIQSGTQSETKRIIHE